MPNPPRTAVFPLPRGLYAKPIRGSKLWVVGLLCQNWPTGTTQPGTEVGLMTAGQGPVPGAAVRSLTKPRRFPLSVGMVSISYLRPRFNVNFLRIRQSSWMYPPKILSWVSTGLVVPLGRTRPFERLLVRKRCSPVSLPEGLNVAEPF